MVSTVKEILKERSTIIYLISYILGKEITHSQIWFFTPLLIMVGVPIEIVSIGWVLNQIMQIIGARLLYIPLVYIINYLGNIRLQLALVGVCGLFLPMCYISYIKLRALEK